MVAESRFSQDEPPPASLDCHMAFFGRVIFYKFQYFTRTTQEQFWNHQPPSASLNCGSFCFMVLSHQNICV